MKANWFKPGRQTQLAISCTCLVAFVLFGYDQGVFGGLVTNTDFLDTFGNPSPGFLGIIVSIYNVGCFLGAALNFFFGAKFGRRDAIWTAMACIFVGAIIQCSAYSVPQLMVGRVFAGLGVGIDTSTVPMYQAELCKPELRGRLVTSEVLFVALGIVVAYFFDYGLSFVQGSIAWRLPIACQILIAVGVSILVIGLPETPRWLCNNGRVEEATAVMCKVYDIPETDPYIVNERKEIIAAIEIETSSPFKWSRVFHRDPMQTGYRIFLACLVLFMNQWSGINVIVFYAATVLEQNVGLDHNTAIIAGGCLNLAFAIGSLVPSLGADKLGRRNPMLFGTAGMALSMMVVAILLSFKGTDKEKPCAYASIAFFVTYMISFGSSLNAIPWLYSTEILPLTVRAQGTALAVFNNWIWVFTIVMITPTLVANLAWKTYLIFMAFNFAFIPVIYFLFPETKGLTLEKIDDIFFKEDRLPAGERLNTSYTGAGVAQSPTDIHENKSSEERIEHSSYTV